MSEDEQFKLLASEGMLVKRPIFVSEDTVLVSPFAQLAFTRVMCLAGVPVDAPASLGWLG